MSLIAEEFGKEGLQVTLTPSLMSAYGHIEGIGSMFRICSVNFRRIKIISTVQGFPDHE